MPVLRRYIHIYTFGADHPLHHRHEGLLGGQPDVVEFVDRGVGEGGKGRHDATNHDPVARIWGNLQSHHLE